MGERVKNGPNGRMGKKTVPVKYALNGAGGETATAAAVSRLNQLTLFPTSQYRLYSLSLSPLTTISPIILFIHAQKENIKNDI